MAYYVKSEFQPLSELNDVLNFANQHRISIKVIEMSVLSDSNIAKNSANRCYYCKKAMLTAIKRKAEEDGFPVLIDGTNASDTASTHLITQALDELSVYSPFRQYGITKSKVRLLSRKAGLFTWNKPAYSCLASHVLTGNKIDTEILRLVEKAESELHTIGFIDFRISRIDKRTAKLQVPVSQMETAVEKRDEIIESLKPEIDSILLDLSV